MKGHFKFDYKSLLRLLPDERQRSIRALRGQIEAKKPSLDVPVWYALIKVLGDNFLEDYRLTSVQIDLLSSGETVSAQEIGKITMMVDLLGGRPISTFQNISDLCRACFSSNNILEISHRLASKFQSLILIEINLRLQLLYRLYLEVYHPSINYSDHLQIVKALQRFEHLAYELLITVNLCNIQRWLTFENTLSQLDTCLEKLSNFAIPLAAVNFRITDYCNSMCRHCYNFSGPDNNQSNIDINKMLEVIRDMPRANIKRLNITGGEPFTQTGTVLSLIKEARLHNIRTITIITNGFWAESIESARKMLSAMNKAGFMNSIGEDTDFIKMSAGIFHQEYVPFKNAINLAQVYYDIYKRPLVIDYEHLENTSDAYYTPMIEVMRNNLEGKVNINYRRVRDAGRGKQLFKEASLENFTHLPPCDSVSQIAFNASGSANPCCTVYQSTGIIIGDIYNDNLLEIVKNLQNHPVFQYVSRYPMLSMLDCLDVSPVPWGYHGRCLFCKYIFENEDNMSTLKKKLSKDQDYYPFWFSIDKLQLYAKGVYGKT